MSFVIVGFVITYFFLLIIALWLIPKVVHHKHIKKIVFIVWLLIPTWDVIIGYPIYKFLCATQAGVKIYKTVDNVEGFYVGDWNSKGYSKVPPIPYEGYQFIDYQEVHHSKPTGRYFRTTWKDANVTKNCIRGIGFPNDYNAKLVQSGKCIVKEEIDENEISRWKTKFKKELIFEIPVVKLKVYQHIEYVDKQTKEVMATGNSIWWQGGWFYGIVSSIEVGSGGTSCDGGLDYTKLKKEVLKPKKGEK